jgi:hypothetical protein
VLARGRKLKHLMTRKRRAGSPRSQLAPTHEFRHQADVHLKQVRCLALRDPVAHHERLGRRAHASRQIRTFARYGLRVGVVVTVPGQAEPWKVSNAAFRILALEVDRLTADSDFMTRATAMHGLHMDMVSGAERLRQAGLLAEAARKLRRSLLQDAGANDWAMELADYLPVLEMWMEGLLGSQGQ